LQRLADELVVLGLVDTLSIETVRQALKKMTFAPGSWKHESCSSIRKNQVPQPSTDTNDIILKMF
jgi:hypothetical protein